MNPHSEAGDSPDQIWEEIHKSLSWTSIMNHVHKPDSWTLFMNHIHKSPSWTSFTNQLHESDSQNTFTTQLHESESWTIFTIHIHESYSKANIRFQITTQSQSNYSHSFQTSHSQVIIINKAQNTINRNYWFIQQLQDKPHFTSVNHFYGTRTSC